MAWVGISNREWIEEHSGGFLEGDVMLAKVSLGFLWIPHEQSSIATTFAFGRGGFLPLLSPDVPFHLLLQNIQRRHAGTQHDVVEFAERELVA